MKRVPALLLLASLVVSCGGDSPAATTSTPTTVGDSSTTAATTTTVANSGASNTLAIVSGRGDDQTFEVGVWFDGPAASLGEILIGIDADDSYPGVGDVSSHLEGWARIVGDRIEVGAHGAVVAGGSAAAVSNWVSVGASGNTLRLFFLGDVAPVAGSVWVVIGTGPGGTAGVVSGQACSARGSELDTAVPGDIPDPGTPCRYPTVP